MYLERQSHNLIARLAARSDYIEVTIMQGLTISGSTLRSHALAMCVLSFLLVPQLNWAAGTVAGTIISSSANLSYELGGLAQAPVTIASATIKVDELIQPILTWQDGAPVSANSPGANNALTFVLTNSGNGYEAFSLTRANGPLPLPSGNYTPLDGSIGSIYLESGLLAGFQATGPNADTVYIPGANDPSLAPDTGKIIYVVSDTPNVPGNALGEVALTAASLTPGAPGALPGASFAGQGEGGVFAVVGSTRAMASATGSYLAVAAASGAGSPDLALNKTVAAVLDPNGTAVLMPGSVMTYQIAATLSGTGTVTNLAITDPLPDSLSFVPGSLVVDGVEQTDAADADKGQFVTATRTVSVSLGNVAAPANIVISFRATIN